MPRAIRTGLLAGALVLCFALVRTDTATALFGACQSNPRGGQMMVNAETGERNRMVAGYRRSTNSLRVVDLERGFDFTCSDATNWQQLALSLGDRPDRARVDAKSLEADGYRPVRRAITVTIRGNRGDDLLVGRRGPDVLRGGPGGDRLVGFGAPDLLVGREGGDLIKAVDGRPDRVNCGKGNDEAIVDQKDAVARCEDVKVR